MVDYTGLQLQLAAAVVPWFVCLVKLTYKEGFQEKRQCRIEQFNSIYGLESVL